MAFSLAFPEARLRLVGRLLFGLWLLLLLTAIAGPVLLDSAEVGDEHTRYPVRLALLYYGLAAAVLLSLTTADWQRFSSLVRLARGCWTLAWAAYVIHVALAFHYYHHWSHADAFERTERLTQFGAGIYISYLFTALWTADVAWWWLAPWRYATRPAWLGWQLHSFLAFIIFNGAVIFAHGFVRWASAVLFALLGLLLLRRFRRKEEATAGTTGSLQRETFPLYHDSSEQPCNPITPRS